MTVNGTGFDFDYLSKINISYIRVLAPVTRQSAALISAISTVYWQKVANVSDLMETKCFNGSQDSSAYSYMCGIQRKYKENMCFTSKLIKN